MFARSLGIFIILLVCLGLGTVWIIERETGADLLPNQQKFITSYKVRSFYTSTKIKLRYWWGKISGSGQDNKFISIRHESVDPKQPHIIKWQDDRGVWHYEYDKKQAPPSQP